MRNGLESLFQTFGLLAILSADDHYSFAVSSVIAAIFLRRSKGSYGYDRLLARRLRLCKNGFEEIDIVLRIDLCGW